MGRVEAKSRESRVRGSLNRGDNSAFHSIICPRYDLDAGHGYMDASLSLSSATMTLPRLRSRQRVVCAFADICVGCHVQRLRMQDVWCWCFAVRGTEHGVVTGYYETQNARTRALSTGCQVPTVVRGIHVHLYIPAFPTHVTGGVCF